MKKRQIEVCFSPALLGVLSVENKIVVVVDIFRASSSICAALENGVKAIIPVAGLDEARELKGKGYMVAAERSGIKSDFADFGNSPMNFSKKIVTGKTIAYSTTNGTRAINMTAGAAHIAVGAFVNHSALLEWISGINKDVLILCAGWKDRFCLEDSAYAGALSESLLQTGMYNTDSDAVTSSIIIWRNLKVNLKDNKTKFAHYHRLKKYQLDEAVDYCLSFNKTKVVPVYKNGLIEKAK